MKLVRPSAKLAPPEGAADHDFTQRLKFSAYETTLDGLAAKNLGLPPLPAFVVGCMWGLLLGMLNGTLVTRFKINALIATLATLAAENTFPRLPVWQNRTVHVAVLRGDAPVPPLPRDLGRWLRAEPEAIRLAPTAKSLLR